METTINDKQYRIGKMDAVRQFHVARRVAPALIGLVGALGAGKQPDKEDFAKAVGPLVQAIAQMSDSDAEYVLGACLSVVSRQTDSTTWAPIWRDQLVFDDIDVRSMMQIAAKVIQANLGNIFGALPASLPAQ